MPRLDGTGPAGKGPKTGAQQGNCEGAKPQTFPRDGRGQGMGRGRKNRPGFGSRLGRLFGRGRGQGQR